MDGTLIGEIAEILKTTGPWGIVVVLGYAYWRNARIKEKEIKELYERITQLSTEQTKALLDMRESIRDLCEMIGIAFLRRRPTSPPISEQKKPER